MNFAFYVSGNAARLRKLLEEDHELLKDVRVIFSEEKSTEYLQPLLAEKGIRYHLCDYTKIEKTLDRNLEMSNKLWEVLQAYEIDYCFCFGNHILKGELLKKFENRIINFHPSLLPLFPGRYAIDQAVKAGVKELGNTAHFIDAGVDTGPIILQHAVSMKVFKEEGYAGVLDYQLLMLKELYESLKLNKVKVRNGKVSFETSGAPAAFFQAR